MECCDIIIQTNSAIETQNLGARLGQFLHGGEILALAGDLGAGKTAFAQGLARGMNISVPVTSPTFTLINQYRAPTGLVLQHVDCYRLANAPLEMWEIGLTDLLAEDDIVVIEWADRIEGLLPAERLDIRFSYLTESQRELCFTARGDRYSMMLHQLAV